MKWQPEIVARLMRTARLSRSATARNSDEFTWPPQAPVEAYDLKTGQIVPLSPVLERDPAPHATLFERRDVSWRRDNLARPVVAALAVLAIVGTAYLAVHRAREGRPSSPLTAEQAAPDGSAVSLPSVSVVTSTPQVAPPIATSSVAPPIGSAVVHRADSRSRDNVRDRGRQPAPGATARPNAGIAAPAPFGWFSLSLPIQAEIFENQQFVGTSDGRRVMLPAGRHHLELVNESLRYREWRSVEIQSGKATSLAIALPAGRLQVNAIPWSEVLIDGRRVGETPLGDLRLPIGSHRIVFRHPMLGELTRTAMIVAGTSTRISVNFNQ